MCYTLRMARGFDLRPGERDLLVGEDPGPVVIVSECEGEI